ncbi:MAG: hypothetical protein WD738_20790 [Pirellulales bacterium]
MKLAVVFGLIGIGFLLLVLSGLWVSWFPGTSMWTPEKNDQWSDVKDRMHNLGFILNDPRNRASMHSGPERGTAKQEFDELKAKYDRLSAEFQTAHDRPHTVSKFLKWSGISLAAIGIIGWYAVKQTS